VRIKVWSQMEWITGLNDEGEGGGSSMARQEKARQYIIYGMA
jgi:hypothetical protein